jgi:hypothetical protein
MAEKTTYYSIIDETSTRAHPSGVLRRIEGDDGEVDEIFSRNLSWEFSPLLYSAENGDLTNEFIEISVDEADRIVERIKAEAAQADD